MNDLLRQLIRNVVNPTTDYLIDINKLADYLVANPPGPKDPFIVVLSEGQIENVVIPYEGYSVEVRDYDAVDAYLEYGDPYDSQPLEDWTEVDEDGDRYAPRIFTA